MRNIDVYNLFYTPKQKSQVVNLIGKESSLNYFLFDMTRKILWDTGANISVIKKNYVRQKIPYLIIRELRKALDNADRQLPSKMG